jgi:hypothetical protein
VAIWRQAAEKGRARMNLYKYHSHPGGLFGFNRPAMFDSVHMYPNMGVEAEQEDVPGRKVEYYRGGKIHRDDGPAIIDTVHYEGTGVTVSWQFWCFENDQAAMIVVEDGVVVDVDLDDWAHHTWLFTVPCPKRGDRVG